LLATKARERGFIGFQKFNLGGNNEDLGVVEVSGRAVGERRPVLAGNNNPLCKRGDIEFESGLPSGFRGPNLRGN
jgi:hypothetical protein